MVFGNNDVWDGSGLKPVQNYKIGGTDKNSKGWNKDSNIRLRFQLGSRLPGQVSPEESSRQSFNTIVDEPCFPEEVPIKGEEVFQLMIYINFRSIFLIFTNLTFGLISSILILKDDSSF